MDNNEFLHIRMILNRTQKEMAQLLGTSIKAIHSYEQGWRSVPSHVERHMFFLVTRKRNNKKGLKACWTIKGCPAWEFRAGRLCWLINGTICEGKVQKDWKGKMKLCRKCTVLTSMIGPVRKEGRKKS